MESKWVLDNQGLTYNLIFSRIQEIVFPVGLFFVKIQMHSWKLL